VSENRYLTPIAKRTVLSDNALSVLVPILEDILGWDSSRIRALFEAHGFVLQEWDKIRTDSLTIREAAAPPAVAGARGSRWSTASGGSQRPPSRARTSSRSRWHSDGRRRSPRCSGGRMARSFTPRPSSSPTWWWPVPRSAPRCAAPPRRLHRPRGMTPRHRRPWLLPAEP